MPHVSIWVKAKRPAFSLYGNQTNTSSNKEVVSSKLKQRIQTEWFQSYTDTEDPLPVPNNPDNRMPTPWREETKCKIISIINLL